MVMAKADMRIAGLYDQVLVDDPAVRQAGRQARNHSLVISLFMPLVTLAPPLVPPLLFRLRPAPPLPPSTTQERAMGEGLRRRYADTIGAVQMVTGHSRLCDNNPTLR